MNEELIAEVVRRVLHRLEAGSLAGGAAPETSRRAASFVPDLSERHGALAPALEASQRPVTPASWPPKVVAVGADHGGFDLKEDLRRFLEAKKIRVLDCGTHTRDSVDYPDFAGAVARAIHSGEAEAGLVVDTMGIGSAMAANKVRGIRCALCHDVETARSSRGHNDANILSIGSKVVSPVLARRILAVWLETAFEGSRHMRRVSKIHELER